MILSIIALSFINLNTFAQDKIGGKIIYHRSMHYTFPPTGNPEWDEYSKTLPNEGRFEKVLYYTSNASLFLEPTAEKEELAIPQQKALYMANYGKTPLPEMKQVYYDLNERRRTEQMEFMTRLFIVESEIPVMNWRLTSDRKKILDFTCMGASLVMGTDSVIAWFAPEIPVATGPAEYIGLPGIILAIEKNKVTIFIATSIDEKLPAAELLVKPVNTKAMSK